MINRIGIAVGVSVLLLATPYAGRASDDTSQSGFTIVPQNPPSNGTKTNKNTKSANPNVTSHVTSRPTTAVKTTNPATPVAGANVTRPGMAGGATPGKPGLPGQPGAGATASAASKKPGVAGGAAAAPGAAAVPEKQTATRTGKERSATQQMDFNKLARDLQAIESKPDPSPEQKARIERDLTALTDGAAKPSPERIHLLSLNLVSALQGQNVVKIDQVRFLKNVEFVLNSNAASEIETNAAVNDAETILLANGIPSDDAKKVSAALIGISAQLRSQAPALPPAVKLSN